MKLEEAKSLKVGDIVYSTRRKEPVRPKDNQITESLTKEEFDKLPPLKYRVVGIGYRNPLGIPLMGICGYACINKKTLDNFSLTKPM